MWWRALRRYVRDWRRGSHVDASIQDELDYHVEMAARDLERAGMPAAEAQDAARRRFGSAAAIHERCRDEKGVGAVEAARRDFAYALRLAVRAPAASAATVVALALAIGGAGGVFCAMYGVAVRPLPYDHPDRLVAVWQTTRDGAGSSVSAANWHDWAADAKSLSGLAAFSTWNFTLTGARGAVRLDGAIVTGTFFDVLGVPAARGRTLDAADARSGADDVVVISDGLWRGRFAADPDIVGRTIQVSGTPSTVVGVMPPGFAYPSPRTSVWMPIAMSPATLANRGGDWLKTVGRLSPGRTLASAREELDGIARHLAEAYPDTNAGKGTLVQPLKTTIVGDLRQTLEAVFAGVCCLFAIALVNVSGLLLARTRSRAEEIATRRALGASPARLARQFVSEGVLLATVAGALGVALAWAAVRAFTHLAPASTPRLGEVAFDGPTVAFCAVLAVVAALVCAGVPAAAAALLTEGRRSDLSARGRGRTTGDRVHAPLVVVQIGATLALLVAAMLVASSYHALASDSPGFDATGVTSMQVSLPRQAYTSNAEQARFFQAVVEGVAAVPGVTAAGAVSDLPLVGNNVSFHLAIRGAHVAPRDEPLVGVRTITPGYLAAMRIRAVEGRGLSAADGPDARPVALVNRTMARRLWNGRALGQAFRIDGDDRWREVVGVIDDVRQITPGEDEGPAVYLPLAQKPFAFLNWMTIVARAAPGVSVASGMRAALASVDPAQAGFDLQTMDERLSTAVAVPRLVMAALAALATVALVLAIVGVYGMFAHVTAQRTREIGIRMALGASAGRVLRLVLGRAAVLTACGLALGAGGALLLGRAVAGLLYRISPHDTTAFAAAAGIVGAAALAASWWPARRASRVDPRIAMRAE
jgi:putative ABC transport system permease protein